MTKILAAGLFLGFSVWLYMYFTDYLTDKAMTRVNGVITLYSIIVVIIHAKWGGGWKGDSDE
ncbi:MAG: hypothetical protein L3J50_07650 [Emcibacter sp.]|nr:hypothetical protein [Emcibacter sp.]